MELAATFVGIVIATVISTLIAQRGKREARTEATQVAASTKSEIKSEQVVSRNQIQSQIDTLKRKNSELEGRLATKDELLASKFHLVTELERRTGELEDGQVKRDQRIRELETEIDTQKAEIELLRQQVAQLEHQNLAVVKERDGARQQLEQANARITLLETRVRELETELAAEKRAAELVYERIVARLAPVVEQKTPAASTDDKPPATDDEDSQPEEATDDRIE